MSDNKIHDDEDYLDSLLKAVMSGNSTTPSDDTIDDEEDEFAKSIDLDFDNDQSEDDFLSEFENDILMSDDIPSPSDSSDTDYMNIDDMFSDNKDILSQAAGDIASISNEMNEETEKPKKRGLFGRKKKIVIADKENDSENADNADNIATADNSYINATNNNIDDNDDIFAQIERSMMAEQAASEEVSANDNTVEEFRFDVDDIATDVTSDDVTMDTTSDDIMSEVTTENLITEVTSNDIMSDNSSDDIMTDTYSSNKDTSVEESLSNINNIDDDLISAFEGLFGGNTNDESENQTGDEFGINKSASGRPEEDINNLMDILGAFGDTEGLSEDELQDVDAENKGGKWKRKKKKKEKKEKKEKKSFFKKKKKGDNQIADGEANADGESPFDSAFASSNNDESADKVSDDFDFGFSFDEMGFSSSGDLFADNSSSGYDENKDLMKKMDRGEIDDDDLLDEEDKKKKKKKKEKKPKKKKAPKKIKDNKKKEKIRDRELDEVIPISKGFMIISLSLVILFVIFLIFGGNQYYYNNKMQIATNMYVEKKYSEAYDALAGLEIDEEDMAFFNQIQTVMYVMRHYEAGLSYIELNSYEEGLHSLVKGVKSYDKYQNAAREHKCFDDMTIVLSWINIKLNEVYGLTESEARELSLINDKFEYAYKIRTIAKEVEKRMEELKNDSNN